MTETKKQIKELKAALPGLKEKVFGVALLLAVSLVMVAAVSYAWVTMSTNPELGGVNTTVAANGALEIALSDFDGEEPEESAAGDSFAAEGQTTHGANITWGNLVNLSSGYGLESLELRPAKLDLTSEKYLYSVKYGQDGRVEGTFSDFGFTTWYQTNATTDTWNFVAPSNYPETYKDGKAYGVRAISSVTYKGQEDENVALLRILSQNQAVIKSNYENNLMGSAENQAVIQELVNEYLAFAIDEAAYKAGQSFGVSLENPGELDDLVLDGPTYIPALTEMVRYFLEDIIVPAGETMVYSANLQSYNGTEYTLEQFTSTTWDRSTLLKDKDPTNENATGIRIASLGYNAQTGKYDSTNPYATLYNTVSADMKTMEALWEANGQPKARFTWKEIKSVVNNLIDINNVRIYDKDGKYYRVGYIVKDAGGTDEVLTLVNEKLPRKGEGILKVELVNGTLKQFEQMSGAAGSLPVEVVAKKSILIISVDYTGDGRITTNADHNNAYFKYDQTYLQTALSAVDKRELVAADTYGMILDLWVRTNAESSMLTLNGTPEVEERQEPVTVTIAGHDAPRDVYIYTYPTGEKMEAGGMSVDVTESIEVYEVFHDPDGEGTEDSNLPEDYYYYKVSNNSMAYEYELVTTTEGETTSSVAQATTTPLGKTPGYGTLAQKTVTVYDVVGFTAANRIWQEDDADKPIPGAGEVSTTQGSGSCYIFHASSEEEYENTKNLLKNLRLVFLDENGNELSRARLDTDRIYAENGKYTVPLYIESYKESITQVTVNEDGTESTTVVTGLCILEKNEPRRISVLVYLEGEKLTNEMVMSKDSVSGSLNLQFDSTADLRSVGDTDLETEMVSLSATIDKTSLEYTGETQYVELKAIIDGLMPSKVEATFYRMYTATQGSAAETVELTQGDDGYWKANMPFYSPGRYVLEALTINGVDYKLAEPLEVNMSGFEVSAAVFDTKAVLTVEQRTTKDLSIQLASDIMPSTVVAQFVSEDSKGNKSFTNVPLTRLEKNWNGTAVFTNSGQYTLTYLIMDGEPYELPENMQRSFMAYLGLTADVVLERYVTDENGKQVIGPLEYTFTGAEKITAFVKIYDDAGVVMNSLGTLQLDYKPAGSSIVANGFTASLEWNGSAYAGEFDANKPGRFVFGQLILGSTGETITTARSASELSIISTVPPSVTLYNADDAITYQNGIAYLDIRIDNAATANSWVVLSDDSGKEYTLALTANGNDTYRVQLPDRSGEQGVNNANGTWTVESVLFDNVYANDKFYIAGGEKYEIDVTDKSYLVVNYVTVETSSVGPLGGTSLEDATAVFMTAYKLYDEGLRVTVRAPIGKSNSTVAVDPSQYSSRLNVASMSIDYDASTDTTHGGYDGASVTTKTFSLTNKANSEDAVIFTIAEANKDDDNVKLQAAGVYTAKKSNVTVNLYDEAYDYAVSQTSKQYTAQADTTIEIFSKKPTVTVTAVSPTGAHNIFTGTRSSDGSVPPDKYINGDFNAMDKYNAVVYIYAGDNWTYNVYIPKVSLQITDMPEEEGSNFTAEMTFTNQYSSDYDATYSFTANNQTLVKDIGGGEDGWTTIFASQNPKIFPAGRQSISEMTVEYGGNTYTVQLSHEVTINQPQYPPYVDFNSTASGQTLPTTPSRIYGTPQADGTFTITLPGSQTWTEDKSTTQNQDFTVTDTITRNVYTERSETSGCDTTTYYTPYIETTTVSQASSSTTTWTRTWRITGWKVGNTTYGVGETIAITGNQTITAVLSYTDGTKTTESSTTTRTVIAYTANGSESTTKPSGSKVNSVEGSTTDVVS